MNFVLLSVNIFTAGPVIAVVVLGLLLGAIAWLAVWGIDTTIQRRRFWPVRLAVGIASSAFLVFTVATLWLT